MRTPLNLPQVKSLLTTVANKPLDPGLQEMLPSETLNYIQSAPDIAKVVSTLEEQLTDLNLAVADYANQSGQGQMMLDNLKLCLEQQRYRRKEAGMHGAIGRQGLG